MTAHYISLIAAYGTGAVLWVLTNYWFKRIWNNQKEVSFQKPWLEFVYAIIAVLGILGIGQLYIRELLLPNNGNVVVDAINQVLIFSPTFLLLLIRKQSLDTIWVPRTKVIIRLAIGLAITLIALFVYYLIRKNANDFGSILVNTYHPKNISYLVQVFMEDITIALIFVRLSAWIGNKKAIILVSILFAAGHIPSLLANGFVITELGSLLFDMAIGIVILSALSKSKDIWWFFMLHFALDMTQFYGGL